MNKEVLIIGAGKIGRGFIGQLFYRSGYRLWFVDSVASLIEGLNKEKKYRVDMAGEGADETEYIQLEKVFSLHDKKNILSVLDRIEIMAISVGAGNLKQTTEFLKALLKKRNKSKRLNILVCENAINPALFIRNILLEGADNEMEAFVKHKLGIIETQVLRTGMMARPEVQAKEPFAVRMQNWWTLPLDKDAFVGDIPDITGFKPRGQFKNELIRKIFTFNGTNGPVAYMGWVNGFGVLHESALAMEPFFREIQEESAWGLLNEYKFNEMEHRDYMALAMKKYTDPALSDPIERNAKDLRRKLGINERMLGPALLCLKHGRRPLSYAIAIAAAYNYDGSDDEGTLAVRKTVKDRGIREAIKIYSGIDEKNELYEMIIDAFENRKFIINANHLQ